MPIITDCGLPTDTATCQEHNVGGCATCIKDEGACDWGGCHEPAAQRVLCVHRMTGRVLEQRPLCDRHSEAYQGLTHGGVYTFETLKL